MSDQEIALALLNQSGPLSPVKNALFIYNYYLKKLPDPDPATALALTKRITYKPTATLEALDKVYQDFVDVQHLLKD